MSEEKKEIPVVKATKVERIVHPDGRVDVVVHVPRLQVLNALKKKREGK